MILLNRKRIVFIASCLMISIFGVSLSQSQVNTEDTIQTSSTPVSGYTIILDAGHGQPDRSVQ